MNQEKFEELILDQLSTMNERMSSIENRMDERMSSIEDKMDKRMSSIEDRLSSLEQGMAWVRGKLEGRGEFWTDIKSWIAIIVAVAAVVVAILN